MHVHDEPNQDERSNSIHIERFDLSDGCTIATCRLPPALIPSTEKFEFLWELHPPEFRTVNIRGPVQLPRWQEAYGQDYRFSGQTAVAQPVPPELLPYLKWAQSALELRLNGILLNWYDGSEQHYIGPHHDKHRQLVPGTPIVTISLGEERVFRLTREEKRDGKKIIAETRDFVVEQGSVIVMPWDTNLAWKHSVPHFARYQGRRISITIRAFW